MKQLYLLLILVFTLSACSKEPPFNGKKSVKGSWLFSEVIRESLTTYADITEEYNGFQLVFGNASAVTLYDNGTVVASGTYTSTTDQETVYDNPNDPDSDYTNYTYQYIGFYWDMFNADLPSGTLDYWKIQQVSSNSLVAETSGGTYDYTFTLK